MDWSLEAGQQSLTLQSGFQQGCCRDCTLIRAGYESMLVCLAGMSRRAAWQLNQYLRDVARRVAHKADWSDLQAQRAALPAAAVREECLQVLQHHQVRPWAHLD